MFLKNNRTNVKCLWWKINERVFMGSIKLKKKDILYTIHLGIFELPFCCLGFFFNLTFVWHNYKGICPGDRKDQIQGITSNAQLSKQKHIADILCPFAGKETNHTLPFPLWSRKITRLNTRSKVPPVFWIAWFWYYLVVYLSLFLG